jgi:hypothetical protein
MEMDKDKVPVVGILKRDADGKSRVRTSVIPNRRKHAEQSEVRKHVEAGSALYTNFLLSYDRLAGDYAHKVADHAVEYARDNVHSNGLENYWGCSSAKRNLCQRETCHLFRCFDEQASYLESGNGQNTRTGNVAELRRS